MSTVTEFLTLRATSPHGDDDGGELTEPPEPETGGDAGAAAFLHGPQGLFGSVATPDTPEDDRDDQVHGGELGHLDFLQVLCQDEITRRETVAFQRRLQRAKFEQRVTLEEFDVGTYFVADAGA